MAVDPKSVFRKVALERLSSPEQLDLLITVLSPRAWIALASAGAVLLAVLVWSLVGSIPETAKATGILVLPGGVFDVFANGQGHVLEVLVSEGQLVRQGDVVARIDQPELTRQVHDTNAQLEELRSQQREVTSYTAKDLRLREDTQLLERTKLEAALTYAEQRLRALKEQIDNEERLLADGLLTKQTLLQTRQAYFATQDQLESARSQLKQLNLTDLSVHTQKRQELATNSFRIAEAERRLAALERQLELASLVTTPYSGRVLEIKADRGDIVTLGFPIASLQISDDQPQGLQAVLYVPAMAGKSVRPGMKVQISPSTAKLQEYGFIMGRVEYVSEFPATREGMMRVLENESLVRTLSGSGAPFAVYASLERDPQTASGYRWSSGKAKRLAVHSGTLSSANVIIREQRPIAMVIPILREYTGL